MAGKNRQSKNCNHNQLPPVTNCDLLLLPQVHLMVSILSTFAARGVHGSRGALPGGGLEMQQQQQQLRRTQSLNLQDVLPWFGPKLSKSAVIYWLFKQNLDQIRQMNDESSQAL